jgi:hypothetical protein
MDMSSFKRLHRWFWYIVRVHVFSIVMTFNWINTLTFVKHLSLNLVIVFVLKSTLFDSNIATPVLTSSLNLSMCLHLKRVSYQKHRVVLAFFS